MINLTEEQQEEVDLKISLAIIKKLYKDKIVDENTYNNIYRKYKTHFQY